LSMYAFYKYYRTSESFRKSEFIAFIIMIIAAEIYRYTEEVSSLYFIHIHFAAALIYFPSILLAIYFIATGRISCVIMCINSILFLLFKDTPSARFFLILLNYQYIYCILPLIEHLRVDVSYYTFNTRDSPSLQPLSLAHQAAVVYAVNQIFYSFTFTFGDKINFDVHPFAGKVGLDAYDFYPVLSAFLMSFHKYGVFSLFCVFAWQLVQLHVYAGGTSMDYKQSEKYVKQFHSYQSNFYVQHWLADLMTASLILYFSMANLGMYLMFWIATRYHPVEEATATTILLGVMGTIYSVFHMIHTYQTQTNKAQPIEKSKQEEP